MLPFTHCSGSTVCVSVFDCLANLLHDNLVVNGVQPKLKLATSINPKLVGGMVRSNNYVYLMNPASHYIRAKFSLLPGRIFLTATTGTHFYFDKESVASSSAHDC